MLGAVHLQIPDGLQVQILVIPVASGAESGECQQEKSAGKSAFSGIFSPSARRKRRLFSSALLYPLPGHPSAGRTGMLASSASGSSSLAKAKGSGGSGISGRTTPPGVSWAMQIVPLWKRIAGQLVGHLMGQQVITVGAVRAGSRPPGSSSPGCSSEFSVGFSGCSAVSGLRLFPLHPPAHLPETTVLLRRRKIPPHPPESLPQTGHYPIPRKRVPQAWAEEWADFPPGQSPGAYTG